MRTLIGIALLLGRPIPKEAESDTQGAFAVDGLPPRTYEIEANAPSSYAALAVEVSVCRSSTVPVEMNVAAVTSTTPTQLTRPTQLTPLKAMDRAFSGKVHNA